MYEKMYAKRTPKGIRFWSVYRIAGGAYDSGHEVPELSEERFHAEVTIADIPKLPTVPSDKPDSYYQWTEMFWIPDSEVWVGFNKGWEGGWSQEKEEYQGYTGPFLVPGQPPPTERDLNDDDIRGFMRRTRILYR